MCGALWVKDTHYMDWDSCMRAGYKDSTEIMKELGVLILAENIPFNLI